MYRFGGYYCATPPEAGQIFDQPGDTLNTSHPQRREVVSKEKQMVTGFWVGKGQNFK
jgi:hypothetical protein